MSTDIISTDALTTDVITTDTLTTDARAASLRPEEVREDHCCALAVDGGVGDKVSDVEHTHRAAGHARGQFAVWQPVGAEHALADGALLRHRHLR